MKLEIEFNTIEELKGILGELILTRKIGEGMLEEDIHWEDTIPVEVGRYTAIFDKNSPNWTKDREYNRVFLIHTQRYLNERLKAKGHLFLNEVFDTLGLPRTNTGAICGWMYKPGDKDHAGDNFIDFGLREPANHEFFDGYGGRFLLDFNVDGVILGQL